MTTYARQHEVLKITEEQALEGFMYFLQVRSSKAEKYHHFVEDRVSCVSTLEQLAIMEKAFGTEKVRNWLDEAVAKAQAKLEGQHER
ncbi:hypothetical protein DC522_05795 [Microvirga sp. KLBC 81]|uniref:hypothetical protein n=1 Tax=Microvirga sp. KLBC 81 TaxID=1862707 RepID=UPI000D511827|nr:hypothetical protein [Microvirga sp. KLBC 81]PVE25407.1 hypothetical protein DC522_05795 [Microvirga sp. KLBC 81]